MADEIQKPARRLPRAVARAFAIALAVTLLLSAYIQYNVSQQERERMDYLAKTLSSETYEIMLSQLSKTRVLEAYLMETGGSYEGFGEIAQILLKEDYVRNVLFAPEGIVQEVYPLKGNESVLGLDMSARAPATRRPRPPWKRASSTWRARSSSSRAATASRAACRCF
jgi:sensor domain CHASE-containing protein